MAKVNVTWLGDEDPSQQVIEQYGHTFVKGEPTPIDDNGPYVAKLRANGFFSFGKDADLIESDAPQPIDPDSGTEIAAVRAELDGLGVKYDGRTGLDKLRQTLAAEQAKRA